MKLIRFGFVIVGIAALSAARPQHASAQIPNGIHICTQSTMEYGQLVCVAETYCWTNNGWRTWSCLD